MVGFGCYKVSDKTLIEYAVSIGYTLFDTARNYKNEHLLANIDNIDVITKLWNTDNSFNKTQLAVDESLERLKNKSVYCFLIHYPFENYKESWEGLKKAKADGKCKYIGISNVTIEDLKTLDGVDVIQNEINSNNYFTCFDLIQFCRKNNIIIQAHRPLDRANFEKYNKKIMLRFLVASNIIPIVGSKNYEHIKENYESISCWL